jgi:hypothetical protein
MYRNIYWPRYLHWRTRKLIKKFPVLKSDKLIDVYFQTVILESELSYIDWLEDSGEYLHKLVAVTKYRAELRYALNQLYYLTQ